MNLDLFDFRSVFLTVLHATVSAEGEEDVLSRKRKQQKQ